MAEAKQKVLAASEAVSGKSAEMERSSHCADEIRRDYLNILKRYQCLNAPILLKARTCLQHPINLLSILPPEMPQGVQVDDFWRRSCFYDGFDIIQTIRKGRIGKCIPQDLL